jgi:hypothetical protein
MYRSALYASIATLIFNEEHHFACLFQPLKFACLFDIHRDERQDPMSLAPEKRALFPTYINAVQK